MDGYYDWQHLEVRVSGSRYALATKPGVFSHGGADPATLLLAERAEVRSGDVVVQMSCAGALFGAVAARGGAARVLLTDRNVLSVEAARRTLVANGVGRGEVFLGQGAAVLPRPLEADLVAIRAPQEKLPLLHLIRDAFEVLRIGGYCYLAGATNEGIKPAARSLERVFGNATTIAHGAGQRLVGAEKRSTAPVDAGDLASPYLDPDVFHEIEATLRGLPIRLFSRPGVFSWDHADEATVVLADTMRVAPGESVLDLGCGSGALGVVAARLSGRGVSMVDADVEAVRSAIRTAAHAGVEATVLASDVASAVLDQRFDVVVTNPPFHVGKATDLSVALQFIEDAWTVLAPGGRLFLVANRTLPYEREVQQRFGSLAIEHDGRRFKVLSAVRGG